eukprot:6407941-Prymnesium_polylepis.1
MVEVQHRDRVLCVEPQHVVARRYLLAAAADAPQDLVLPSCKCLERGGLIHGLGGSVLEDVVSPSR